MVDCAETIKHLDLEPWKEEGPVDKTCEVGVFLLLVWMHKRNWWPLSTLNNYINSYSTPILNNDLIALEK